MKKILFFLTVLLLPFLIKAQDPQPVYGDYVYPGSVFFDNGLYIPVRDTTGFAPYRVGAMVILPQDTIGHTTTPPVRFWNGVYWGTISGGSGGVYFAGNGLSLTGNTFKLGGTPLSQNTDILSNGYTFTVNNSAKGLPILGLTPSGQRIGYRELDSTQSGFDFTPNGKQGIFKFYLKGASIATLQQGSLQLSDSLTNVYFYAGKDIVNLIGSSGSNYAQFQPGNVSFNTSSGSNIAQFTTGYAKLPAYTNTDSTKYLTTNSSGQLVLKSPSAIRAIDSVVMDFPSGTISYRYTTGGYLPVFIGKPVDSLRYDPSTGIFYTRLTTGGEVAVPTGLVDSLKNKYDSADVRGAITPKVEILLPSNIYAVEGAESNIYLRNVILNDLGIADLKYRVACTKGMLLDNRWTYTPLAADSGSYSFNISVLYKTDTIATKTITLNVTKRSAGSGTRKAILIGDSQLYAGQVPDTIKADYVDAFTLSFQGRFSTAGGNRVEAQSGFKWYDYTHTPRFGTNPFWTGYINISNYLTSNSITMSANDWWTIQLGTNDVYSFPDTTTLMKCINDSVLVYADSLTNAILTQSPGTRIAIVIPPIGASQDAFGIFYSQNLLPYWQFNYNIMRYAKAIIAKYDTPAYRALGVYVLAVSANYDVVHNAQFIQGRVNARNPETYIQSNNSVHPSNYGYAQFADTYYSFFKWYK